MSDKTYQVNSVVKALTVLETLAAHGKMSIAMLHAELGLDKGTLHRMLATLKQQGYVQQSSTTQRYSLTYKMFYLGNQEVERAGFRGLLHTYLERIGSEFDEMCYASALLEPGKAICIDKRETDAGQQVRLLSINIGSLVSLHASSTGKSLLAFSDPRQLPEIIAGLDFEAFTEHTVKTSAELMARLELIRSNGYSLDDEERIAGIFCISVPLLNNQGLSQGAITVTGLKAGMLEKKDRIIQALMAAGLEISRLSGAPPDKIPECWKRRGSV